MVPFILNCYVKCQTLTFDIFFKKKKKKGKTYPREDSSKHIIISAIHGAIRHSIGDEIKQNGVRHGGVNDGLEEVDSKTSKNRLSGGRIASHIGKLGKTIFNRNRYP